MLYLLVNKSHLNIWVDSPLLQWVPHSIRLDLTVSARSIQRGALGAGWSLWRHLNWTVLGNHPQLGLFQVILSYIVNYYHVHSSMAASRSALSSGKTTETIGRPRGLSVPGWPVTFMAPDQWKSWGGWSLGWLKHPWPRSFLVGLQNSGAWGVPGHEPAGNESEFHPVLGWVS